MISLLTRLESLTAPSREVSDELLLSWGWQTMETAPRDGAHVLLSCGKMICVGWYAEYLNEADDAGWTCGSVKSWSYEEFAHVEPTHWRPLPAPPETKEG